MKCFTVNFLLINPTLQSEIAMWGIVASSFATFVAAKKSHVAIVLVCVALIFRGATTAELLDALRTLCGDKPSAICDRPEHRPAKG